MATQINPAQFSPLSPHRENEATDRHGRACAEGESDLPLLENNDPAPWLAESGSPAEFRSQCRRIQEYLWQAQATTKTTSEFFLASLLQGVWHSLRNLAGDQPYPPEPEPPRSCAQAIRLLDLTIHWCDNRPTSAIGRSGGHANDFMVASAPFSPAHQATEGNIFDLLKIKERIDPLCSYIGQSPAILQVFKEIETFNQSPTKPVVIVGPTGAGKTEIAQLIHTSSTRRAKGFHREQGADTKASDFSIVLSHWVGLGKDPGLANAPKGPRRGILENFEGGTIFLDEVHATTRTFQRFLHDVLDRKPIPLAIGEAEPVVPDVRMIFGTNVDLDQAVRDGVLLHDFHRRIKTRVLVIPPLAHRKEDIPLFVQARYHDYRITPEARLCLLEYSWPGNVGELLEVLELAKDQAGRPGAKITLNHLSGLQDRGLVAAVRKLPEGEAEKRVFRMLWDMLEGQGWRPGRRGHALQNQLAKLMGVSPPTITRRAQDYLGRKATPM
jgi:DNA-binding NtrC family response regulator